MKSIGKREQSVLLYLLPHYLPTSMFFTLESRIVLVGLFLQSWSFLFAQLLNTVYVKQISCNIHRIYKKLINFYMYDDGEDHDVSHLE